LKLIRLKKGFQLFNVQVIMSYIKMFSKKKIDRIIKNDPDLAENFLQDNNNISLLVQINAAIQILKLLVIIINLTIVVGSLMYIIFYIINEAKQQEFKNMTPYELSLVNS